VRVICCQIGANFAYVMKFAARCLNPTQEREVLFVSGDFSNNIDEFDATTGDFIRDLSTGLSYPAQLGISGNGTLWAAQSGPSNDIQLNTATGATITQTSPSSGNYMYALSIAPDGSVYSADLNNSTVYHYTSTGSPINSFALSQSPDPNSLAIAPSGDLYAGDLYVSSNTNSSISQRFSGVTGDYLGQTAPLDNGDYIYQDTVGPNGNLFAVDESANDVVEFTGPNGTPVVFTSGGDLYAPVGLAFGNDASLSPVPALPIPLMLAFGMLTPWLVRCMRVRQPVLFNAG
jgi:hypothetical protein